MTGCCTTRTCAQEASRSASRHRIGRVRRMGGFRGNAAMIITSGTERSVRVAGTLYVVATPIGNLADLSARAREVLGAVAAICAEDTRHTRSLLAAHGLERPLLALHEHN